MKTGVIVWDLSPLKASRRRVPVQRPVGEVWLIRINIIYYEKIYGRLPAIYLF